HPEIPGRAATPPALDEPVDSAERLERGGALGAGGEVHLLPEDREMRSELLRRDRGHGASSFGSPRGCHAADPAAATMVQPGGGAGAPRADGTRVSATRTARRDDARPMGRAAAAFEVTKPGSGSGPGRSVRSEEPLGVAESDRLGEIGRELVEPVL